MESWMHARNELVEQFTFEHTWNIHSKARSALKSNATLSPRHCMAAKQNIASSSLVVCPTSSAIRGFVTRHRCSLDLLEQVSTCSRMNRKSNRLDRRPFEYQPKSRRWPAKGGFSESATNVQHVYHMNLVSWSTIELQDNNHIRDRTCVAHVSTWVTH